MFKSSSGDFGCADTCHICGEVVWITFKKFKVIMPSGRTISKQGTWHFTCLDCETIYTFNTREKAIPILQFLEEDEDLNLTKDDYVLALDRLKDREKVIQGKIDSLTTPEIALSLSSKRQTIEIK